MKRLIQVPLTETLLVLLASALLAQTRKSCAVPGKEVTLAYIKSSDTLLAPGFFGQSEYKRAK
jgi:hypothetical protein